MIMATILALDALLLEPANTCALRREPTERLVAGAGTSKAVGTVFTYLRGARWRRIKVNPRIARI